MRKLFFWLFIILAQISTIISQEVIPPLAQNNDEQFIYVKIPVIEIPQKIEEVYALLKRINDLELPATEIEKLEESFIKFVDEISQAKKETDLSQFENITIKKLKDYNLKWNTYRLSLEDFKRTLQTNSERLDKEKEQIERILEYINLTAKNAKEEKAPQQLLKRLSELEVDVKITDKSLFTTLRKVLSLRDKVSIEEVGVNEKIALINKQIEANRSLLFTLDSPTLWNALSDSSDTTTFASTFNNSTKRIQLGANEFWDIYSEEFPYYIGFSFIIFLLILYLRRFANKKFEESSEEENQYSLKLLNKPISITLLITIYVELIFFPLAPSVIAEISRILLVIPILLLFPTFISSTSRRPLYIITFIYLFQQVIDLLIGNSIYLRVSIIILTISMIAGLYLFLIIDTVKLVETRVKLVNTLQIIAKLLIVVLSISLLGNIIGNTALSTLIFYGVMRTIYTSLILITTLQVFYTLLTILLETRMAKFSFMVKRKSDILKKTIFNIAKLAAVLFWVKAFLNHFELYEPISKYFIDFFSTPLEIGVVSISPSSIVLFFISIWISTKFSEVMRFFLENEFFPRVVLPRGVPGAISLIIHYTILTLGFLFALTLLGFNVEKFAIVAGALGVGIGFGLQSIVNNFISGLILLFERPIQVGDIISLTNLIGNVKRIGIRASVIQTFDGAEVIVPNADLISGQVTNWTLSDQLRRIEIKIGVHYSANPEEVMNILKSALEEEKDILKNPSPYILFKGHGDSTQNFDLRFWTSNSNDWIFLRSNVLLKITRLLNEAGIEIPYQQQNVYIKEMEKVNNSKK